MGKKATEKVAVTMRALIQRINRKLRDQDEVLKTSRGERARNEIGNYYCLDIKRNALSAKHVDPEEWGRDLGVLRPWERVIENGGR
jgi:hypothetical protein